MVYDLPRKWFRIWQKCNQSVIVEFLGDADGLWTLCVTRGRPADSTGSRLVDFMVDFGFCVFVSVNRKKPMAYTIGTECYSRRSFIFLGKAAVIFPENMFHFIFTFIFIWWIICTLENEMVLFLHDECFIVGFLNRAVGGCMGGRELVLYMYYILFEHR